MSNRFFLQKKWSLRKRQGHNNIFVNIDKYNFPLKVAPPFSGKSDFEKKFISIFLKKDY